jgi:hypothetical protein
MLALAGVQVRRDAGEAATNERIRGRVCRYCLQLERYLLDPVSVEFEFDGEVARARPVLASDPSGVMISTKCSSVVSLLRGQTRFLLLPTIQIRVSGGLPPGLSDPATHCRRRKNLTLRGRRCRLIQDFIPVVPVGHRCLGPPLNHPHGSDLDSPWRSAAPLGSALPITIAAPSGWFAPRGDRWADW